jgi:hypothetical protein
MKTNQFFKNTIDTYNQILFEFDKAFMGVQNGYDSYNELTKEFDEEIYDYVVYSNPLENLKIQLGDLRKMKTFLIENYPRLIEGDPGDMLKSFNILVFQSEELIDRVENFLLFEPHIEMGNLDSAKNTTAHFDLIACSSVKILASINRMKELMAVKAAA